MGFFSKFENKMEDTFEGTADKISNAPISPVQINKKADKQMRREKIVGAGKEYAPTLYTVLVNPDDDGRLFGFYPTMAGECETYLKAKASEEGLIMDGNPLVRFVVDDTLKHGKFDIIAEAVAAPIVEQLREEEMERYGLAPQADYGYSDYGYDDSYSDYDQSYEGEDWGEYGYDEADNQSGVPSQPLDGRQQPQAQAANTIAYAGGANGGDIPNQANAQARLIDIAYHRAYDLGGAHITIGREVDNDIVVQDINASRKHAELRLAPQGYWTITDLGSMNGTLVNGQAVASSPLQAGDAITIGKTEFKFTLV